MKNVWLMIMSIVAALALFTGCKGDEPLDNPGNAELTLTQTLVEVTAEGGHFEVGYTLKNPVDGEKVTINSEGKPWLKNIVVKDSVIAFDVDESYEKEERTSRIELLYPGVYPNPTITVKQAIGKEYSIKLDFISATATTITLDVIPKDKSMPYVFILGNGKYILENGLMENDSALWASDMEVFESFAAAFGGNVSNAAKAFMYVGELKSHTFTGVSSNTEYVAYAYGFDTETMQPTTEVSRLLIKTADVSEYALDCDFNVEVDGPQVSIDITPQGYDGYYYFGVFWAKDVPPGTTPERLRELCEADWEQTKAQYSSFFDTPEEGLHFIFNELAYTGTTHLDVELDANTEFVLWAFGMDGEALLNTVPDTYYFSTGSVAKSDNVFTLSVADIYPRKATVSIETTNDDSYVATLVTSQRFANKTDDEIVQYIIENFSLQYASGDMSETATGLLPSTEYELLVFGCQVGSPTTDLKRLKFTTPEVVYADLDFSLSLGNYYNGTELAALNPDYAAFSGYAIVNVATNVDTEAVNCYFSAMNASEYSSYSYEQIVEGLTADNPAEREGSYLYEFDVPYIFFGIAEDADGNFTEVWRSKEIMFTREGCSPAEEFFEAKNEAPIRRTGVARTATRGAMLSAEQ